MQEREAVAQLICQERGWQYTVHTDQTLPSGFEYASLDFLSAFRSECYGDVEAGDWWMGKLKGQGQVHPKFVINQMEQNLKADVLLNSLYHMLWYSEVELNRHQPFFWQGDFHPRARIWLPEGGER